MCVPVIKITMHIKYNKNTSIVLIDLMKLIKVIIKIYYRNYFNIYVRHIIFIKVIYICIYLNKILIVHYVISVS